MCLTIIEPQLGHDGSFIRQTNLIPIVIVAYSYYRLQPLQPRQQ